MSDLKKTALVLAVGGSLAMLAPGFAQADVMATAVLQTNHFEISSGGTALDYNTDFTNISFTTTGGYSGTLPGTGGYNLSTSSGLPLSSVDLPKVCVGGGCTAWNAAYGIEDSFTNLTSPPVGNYSAADQQEAGAPISNVPASGGGTAALGATVSNGAYAGLTTQSGLSHSTSTNNLNTQVVFTLAHAGGLTFDLDLAAFLDVYVTADEVAPGFATASYTGSFTLTNLTSGIVLQTLNTDVFGNGVNTISLNAPPLGATEQIQDSGGFSHFTFNTVVLNNTDVYQLSFRNNVNADAERVTVPEPATMALLGMGLAGLGFSTRRRRSQAV
jgi:hypothetical protein